MGAWGAALQGVLSVDSSITKGREEGEQARANIEQANDAAFEAQKRGSADASATRAAGSQLANRQFVAYSNSGVDATVGTAADVQAYTEARAEMDALTEENDAAREAWGYKKHRLAFQQQAGINHAKRNREIAGTVLGGIGQGMSEYSKYGTLNGVKKS